MRSQPASAEFKSSFQESLSVCRRYQMAIHGDPESKCTESQYKRFLVKSPLEVERINPTMFEDSILKLQSALSPSLAWFEMGTVTLLVYH